jgi:hypothetical protein
MLNDELKMITGSRRKPKMSVLNSTRSEHHHTNTTATNNDNDNNDNNTNPSQCSACTHVFGQQAGT